MQDFLNKVGKSAAAAANKAGNKAGEVIEVGKIKSRISSEKSDIAVAKKDIGDYCYKLFEDGKIEDEAIKELCEKIKECYNTIEELEEQILKAKDDYKAKAGEDPTL
ncbi:MAG: hypothetical protein Q4C25_08765 [Bacillota bacterium]|nr:hypothetical protein [Bacillota bacterium]